MEDPPPTLTVSFSFILPLSSSSPSCIPLLLSLSIVIIICLIVSFPYFTAAFDPPPSYSDSLILLSSVLPPLLSARLSHFQPHLTSLPYKTEPPCIHPSVWVLLPDDTSLSVSSSRHQSLHPPAPHRILSFFLRLTVRLFIDRL